MTSFALPIPSATGSLDTYIQTVNRFPILTQEDETRLARRYRDHEDLEAARALIVSHLRVVVAVARGFLRGLIGLGLNRNRTSQFPSGVDRVIARGSSWIAYDSSTGTLYRSGKAIAQSVGPHAFALTSNGIVWWDDTAPRLHKTTAVQHD